MGIKVQSRIQDCIDFVASEARYHQICRIRFQTSKNLSDELKAKKQKGRRKSEEMMECFQKVCEWLEIEASVQTMPDLRNKLIEYSGKDDVYDLRYLKKIAE